MIYLMKQKLIAFGDDFIIKDADGRDAFFVDGKAWSLGHQLSFRDMVGNELAFIKQKLLSWGPTYEVYRSGHLQAVVKKPLFTLFRYKFTVDVEGPDDLEVEGDFFDYEYVFRRGSRQVAVVSRRIFSWTDTYGVDVAAGEDDVLVLASAVVIDMVTNQDKG